MGVGGGEMWWGEGCGAGQRRSLPHQPGNRWYVKTSVGVGGGEMWWGEGCGAGQRRSLPHQPGNRWNVEASVGVGGGHMVRDGGYVVQVVMVVVGGGGGGGGGLTCIFGRALDGVRVGGWSRTDCPTLFPLAWVMITRSCA